MLVPVAALRSAMRLGLFHPRASPTAPTFWMLTPLAAPVPAPPPPFSPPSTPGRRMPPGRGVKERKVRDGSASRLLAAGLDLATESLEVLDVFYRHVPKEIKRKYDRSRRGKFRAIYEAWPDLDLGSIAQDLRLEFFSEDQAYGAAFKSMDKWWDANVGGSRTLVWDLWGY